MRNPGITSNVIRFPSREPSFERRRRQYADLGLTCLALAVHRETDKALLVSDSADIARAVWCPKVMLRIDPAATACGFIVATMTSGFAQQKGLWPRFVDRTSWSDDKCAALACVERLAAEKRLQYRGFQQPLSFPGRNAFA
ncbi:hypothetical protein [Bradyrhizobium elkanii]|uniref:hypothetical protein n=1 Tax=Bradyrhizobium elkanii TaxID=29448 RepID=UPI00084145E1|nr:hypothetical protein [Bradyrhizobium elkanii]ODM71730.1 hypothetical protein A6X20_07250 [Bradyrhizobium elkanii]ODM79103.1 hypothetical protein A6452_28835 [Bradyrhizobium elkanii]